jgi:hypothetical protein
VRWGASNNVSSNKAVELTAGRCRVGGKHERFLIDDGENALERGFHGLLPVILRGILILSSRRNFLTVVIPTKVGTQTFRMRIG